jgi:hypothetical protein
MYYVGLDASGTTRVLSAVSSDGLTWTKEAGFRLEPGGVDNAAQILEPAVVQVSANLLRMYYMGSAAGGWQIFSATSPDGITWVKKNGVRIAPGGPYDAVHVGSPEVVGTSGGLLRMYYSGSNSAATTSGSILSAISSDGLTWTKESGVRLAPGGNETGLDTDLWGPDVRLLPNGTMRMYYVGAGGPGRIFSASSSNGLAWVNDPGVRIDLGASGAPDAGRVLSGVVATMANGVLRHYYTGVDSSVGRRILSATMAPFLSVMIDIKPGDHPNSINLGSNGTVPVAVFSNLRRVSSTLRHPACEFTDFFL